MSESHDHDKLVFMITLTYVAAVLVVGLLLFFIPKNGKVNQIGFALFCIAAFWIVAALRGGSIRF